MYTFKLHYVIGAIRDYARLAVSQATDSSTHDYAQEIEDALKKIETMIEVYKQDAVVEQLKIAIKAFEK